MATRAKTKPEVNIGGRPPLPPDEKLNIVPIRLSAAHKEKFHRIGGVARLREWLDRVKED